MYQSVYVLSVSSCHKVKIMTNILKELCKISFLCRLIRLSQRNMVRIPKEDQDIFLLFL